jgi:oxygen-dependent protoporphyrinogen oxidase
MRATHEAVSEEAGRSPERAPWHVEPRRPEHLRVVVVGGGIAGLTLAHDLQSAADVIVLEASPVAGGHAITVREDGFIVEGGPTAFADRRNGPRLLAHQLGLEDQLLVAPAAVRRRLVVRGRHLCAIPDSARAILRSELFSPMGKLRLLIEPLVPHRHGHEEETVDQFAQRRVGREAAALIDAAVAGSIAAGDSRELSLPAAFPGLGRIERERGRLLRGFFGREHAVSPEPGLLAFRQGMGQLVQALVTRLGPRLRTGTRVTGIEPGASGGTWRVVTVGGTKHDADRVVLALPSDEAARLIDPVDAELARLLAARTFAGVAVVALAYRAADFRVPLPGYGYIVPRRERMATLAVTIESSIFPGRAPDGFILVRVVLGGTRHPEVVNAPEAMRIELAHREFARVLGVAALPVHAWTFSWPNALPQYGMRHREDVAAARILATRHPGLLLSGTSYEGIDLDAAIESARAHAQGILSGVE